MSFKSLINKLFPSPYDKTFRELEEKLARAARLTQDGLDPEDPDDSFMIKCLDKRRSDRLKEQAKKRTDDIRRLAQQFLVSTTSTGVNTRDAKSAVDLATRIYDLVQEQAVLPQVTQGESL